MRRKEKEVYDNQKTKEIILSCHCCRLGFYDGKEIYIVPMNFGYDEKGGKKIFYFHSAKEGRKIDIISKTNYVGFELDTNYELIKSETACKCSAHYQSIIGTGYITFIEKLEEKKEALKAIMFHNTKKFNWDFTTAMLDAVSVFKLEVEKISCKESL